MMKTLIFCAMVSLFFSFCSAFVFIYSFFGAPPLFSPVCVCVCVRARARVFEFDVRACEQACEYVFVCVCVYACVCAHNKVIL